MRPTMLKLNGMALERKNEISQMTHNRSIIVDTHAFGSFRKDLIHNIGLERSKGFLFRYGWNLGRQDAKDCKELGEYESIEELIEYGPVLHSLKGYVKSITTKLEIKKENGVESLYMESIWENSFEAEEHLDKIGRSSSPVCYSLAGYASGYVSEVFGQRVIFKEVCCRAAGGDQCYSIGKSENLWGDDIKEELYFLHEMPIVEELELTYEKLLHEREQLMTANEINKILTKEVVNGADLELIIEEVYRLTSLPTTVHTVKGHLIAQAGFTPHSEALDPQCISQYLNNDQYKHLSTQALQTIECGQKTYKLLISPIILQKKLHGYCSFLFKNEEDYKENYSQLIIDKVSSVCALSLFYEKTKLDSFEQMKSLLFKEILEGQFTTNEEILAKANLFQLDLSKPYYISVMEYRNEFEDYQQEIEFRREWSITITEYFKRQKRQHLIQQKEKKICILFTDESEEDLLKPFIEELYHKIKTKIPKLDLYIGISKRSFSINQANKAFEHAMAALRMAFKEKKIVYFASLGVVGALINDHNERDVREMAYSYLGNLNIHSQKDSDLIQTLYSFLLNGGNLEKTADDLTLSISGLRYRINKLEELMQKDLRSPIVSYQMLLAIQALIILGDLDIKANVV